MKKQSRQSQGIRADVSKIGSRAIENLWTQELALGSSSKTEKLIARPVKKKGGIEHHQKQRAFLQTGKT